MHCRWYGDGEPSLCFVERKTHRESWKGEESVKERFTLKEEQVVPFLTAQLKLEDAVQQLKSKVSLETPPGFSSQLINPLWSKSVWMFQYGDTLRGRKFTHRSCSLGCSDHVQMHERVDKLYS